MLKQCMAQSPSTQEKPAHLNPHQPINPRKPIKIFLYYRIPNLIILTNWTTWHVSIQYTLKFKDELMEQTYKSGYTVLQLSTQSGEKA